VSVEGRTRNMPLCECWRKPGPRLRASVDHSTVTVYAEDTSPLWRKDFGEPIVHAEAADLDADAFYEIVIGLRSRIIVLDRDGQELWRRSGEPMTLATFTTGDLYEKHTNQIVALWNDTGASTSRMTVLDSHGKERTRDYPGLLLRHVAIGRPTNMHAPKIAVATDSRELRILDSDHDSRHDLAVDTASGTTWFTFDGKILRQSTKEAWQEVSVR
jgi:hypothetical protein